MSRRACRTVEDSAAFDVVCCDLAGRVVAYLRRRVQDDQLALDLAGETILSAFEQRRRFRGGTVAELEGWVFSIARTRVLHHQRRVRIERRTVMRLCGELRTADTARERAEELVTATQAEGRAVEELKRLPGPQQLAVRGRVLDGRPYARLACDWGVSEQVARARVSRGLRTLRARLADDQLPT